MTTCELRLKAAEIIEQRGWIQGSRQESRGVCLIGALCMAATGDAWGDKEPTIPAVSDMGFIDTQVAIYWNDDFGRTKAEVLARLRAGCQP